MQYTFINSLGKKQTINVPQEYIDKQRQSLGCSVKEACELYAFDEGYADNETANELNDKATKSSKRKGRKRKPDAVKRALIEYLMECIDGKAFATADGMNVCEDAGIINPERIIQFMIGDDTYEITLSKKRK